MSYEDMARSHVKELAREAFELSQIVVDEDGDLPFPCGTALVFVSLVRDGRVVRVWSRAVAGVKIDKAVLREVDEVNGGLLFARVFTRHDAVFVEGCSHVESMSVQDLGALVAEVGQTADRLGSMLAAVHGGQLAFPGGCAPECERED